MVYKGNLLLSPSLGNTSPILRPVGKTSRSFHRMRSCARAFVKGFRRNRVLLCTNDEGKKSVVRAWEQRPQDLNASTHHAACCVAQTLLGLHMLCLGHQCCLLRIAQYKLFTLLFADKAPIQPETYPARNMRLMLYPQSHLQQLNSPLLSSYPLLRSNFTQHGSPQTRP